MQKDQFRYYLKKYAGLIITTGVNLKKGQYLLISTLTVHRDLALACAEQAYRHGASFVNIYYQDERLQKLLLEHAPDETIENIPEGMIKTYEELIGKNGVFISISGRENIETFHSIDPPRSSRLILARAKKLEFFHKLLQQNDFKWCVAAGASEGVARVLFNHTKPAQALRKHWDMIFRICRIYDEDPEKSWQNHIARIKKRIELLDQLQIADLHFTGPTVDLHVGLHKNAVWKGGASLSKKGEEFLPNIPTEEVFTVPDFHKVHGYVQSTRPIIYKSFLIDKIILEYKSGRLHSVSGSERIEHLREVLDFEQSNGQLGEVALVDTHSEIYKSGLVFRDLLYDENAVSHIALGSAYPECLNGFHGYTAEEKKESGFNTSKIHIDIPIGSEQVDVQATSYDGTKYNIIRKGEFVL